ncbi:MAG: T9SS type A sorting domain-containing protein [Bacteroidetes bacterium]|nr:T9SS type A sorting domain-containing protein [Bacteroidota bacterium]
MSSLATNTQRTGLTDFGDFATAQSTSPLPIHLLNFDAVVVKEGVMTNWTTATEINNDYFVVERSRDGIDFTSVGEVDGAGNSTQNKSYSLLDKDPGIGIIYYRLKQIDYDGKFSFSDVVAVKIKKATTGIAVFPNPAASNIHYQYESSGGHIQIQVVDVIGQIVYQEDANEKAGTVLSEIDIKTLPEGVYSILIIDDKETQKGWFVKKNK